MSHIRIISYLPNPRVYKATIVARYSGAEIEVLGDKPPEMAHWLWDYDAFKMTDADKQKHADSLRQAKTGFQGGVYKTEAFLKANPFGDIPMAFVNDGADGVFESNSLMRLAALSGPNAPVLYGATPYEQARIEGFLDKTLLFADQLQKYVLAGAALNYDLYEAMTAAFDKYCSVLNGVLARQPFLVGTALSLADVVMVCEFALMSYEGQMGDSLNKLGCDALLPRLAEYGALYAHIERLLAIEAFRQDLAPYVKFMGFEGLAATS